MVQMAVRTWPTKLFGRIPELDKHITQTISAVPRLRYQVQDQFFANLTLARQEVERAFGINVGRDLSTNVEFVPHYGHKCPNRKKSTTMKGDKLMKPENKVVHRELMAQLAQLEAINAEELTGKKLEEHKQALKTTRMKLAFSNRRLDKDRVIRRNARDAEKSAARIASAESAFPIADASHQSKPIAQHKPATLTLMPRFDINVSQGQLHVTCHSVEDFERALAWINKSGLVK